MIHKLRFKSDFRCFKSGFEMSFRQGVNLLVGDQGSGKSTIFQVIRSMAAGKCVADAGIFADDGTRVVSYDFEKENPRTQDIRASRRPTMFDLSCRKHSHGQAVNALLAGIDKESDITLLMDEPDMALSIRSIATLVGKLRQAVQFNCQVIAAVHNPLLINSFDEVFSVEHRQWMQSSQFVALHWQPSEAVT